MVVYPVRILAAQNKPGKLLERQRQNYTVCRCPPQAGDNEDGQCDVDGWTGIKLPD